MDSRKLKILQAVVDEYIVTGEPVGSKAIMKHVKASSATIRNEMAELEKQGYFRAAAHIGGQSSDIQRLQNVRRYAYGARSAYR